MINGKWMKKRKKEGGCEEREENKGEEDRNEIKGGQQFGVSMLLDIHYY